MLLAETGLFCLSSILFFIIGSIPYSKGVIAGASVNVILFLIFLSFVVDAPSGGNDAYVTNLNQTKWARIDDPLVVKGSSYWGGNEIYRDHIPYPDDLFDGRHVHKYVLSAKEIKEIKAKTGEDPVIEDYWIVSEPISAYKAENAMKGIKETKLPSWLYHPMSPVWIFGFLSLPALLAGGAIVGLLNK